MNKSLQRHLSLTLALAIVLTGLVTGAVSFRFAYDEAQEFQDDTLRKIAAWVDVNPLPGQAASDSSADGLSHTENDPENQVMVMRLSADRKTAPIAWLPADLQPGFHTLDHRHSGWRVFVRQAKQGARIAVAQKTAVRDEMAVNSALGTLVPLLILLPLLVWLSTHIVRTELAPLRRLAQTLDGQPAERPAALPDIGLPNEIAPFVTAINRLLARVAVLMSEQQRFIADAAHELRSPLTALSLQAQNLENADTVEAMHERITPLRAGVERARRLTEQLLSLAKSQTSIPSKVQLDVSKIARELIAEYLPIAEARGIDLGLDDAGNIVVAAEPQTLHLVLKNALENALHHTPAHGEVTLRLYADDKDVVIEIVDTGVGIPTSERELVFEPFYRIEGASGEGNGLGLAIARDAATRLGGTVSVHDRTFGPGLVFCYRQRRIA